MSNSTENTELQEETGFRDGVTRYKYMPSALKPSSQRGLYLKFMEKLTPDASIPFFRFIVSLFGMFAAVILLGDNDIVELSKACKNDSSKLRNVAGELLGAELAIEYCKEHGISKLAIHYDYEGVGAWADDAWKAKLPETKAYRNYVFDSREALDIKFIKVKGHSGNEYNNRADYLAGKALSV